ncbi:hypothetical protein NKK47_33035 [Mesorhizobium sp. M0019]
MKSTLPPERLLTYQVSEGWEPLCAFLDVQLPCLPNRFHAPIRTAEFRARVGR